MFKTGQKPSPGAESQQECRQANVNGSHLPGGPSLPHPRHAHIQFLKPLKRVLTYSQVNFSLNHWTVLLEQGDLTAVSQIVFCRMLISDRYQEKGAQHTSEAPAYTKQNRLFYHRLLSTCRTLMCAEDCLSASLDHRCLRTGVHHHNPRLSGIWGDGCLRTGVHHHNPRCLVSGEMGVSGLASTTTTQDVWCLGRWASQDWRPPPQPKMSGVWGHGCLRTGIHHHNPRCLVYVEMGVSGPASTTTQDVWCMGTWLSKDRHPPPQPKMSGVWGDRRLRTGIHQHNPRCLESGETGETAPRSVPLCGSSTA